MKEIRDVIAEILASPVKVVIIDTPTQFIHLDKMKAGNWRLSVTKDLVENPKK